jgi:polysaccharide export outer membrane protein
MKKLALFLAVIMVTSMPLTAVGQASRYRVPTQAEEINLGPAPSFRSGRPGSSGAGVQYPSQQTMPQLPQSLTGGGAGTTMGETMMTSMGYQVHVLGEVMKPGTYRVAASDRVSEVISRAGGLAVNGSERNIEIRRRGGGVTHVDLLAFKLFGRLDQNPYVTDNDTVFVPLRKDVIQVVGAVKRPEFYELKNEKTLSQVLELAGGFNAATAMQEPIRIIRFKEGVKSIEEVPIENETMKKFDILNGDVVVVPNIVTKGTKFDYNVASIPGDQVFYPSYEDRVFVLGGVAFPGAYEFSPYYTVSQYITLAGGLNERGKTKYKVITIEGKTKKVKPNDRVNPGDTIAVKQSWMSPASWMSFALGVASFGLSASATIIAIRK